MNSVQPIRSARRAVTLLAHPLRTRILAFAQQPISASDLARRLQQPRQRVHYHVRQLAQEGFLEPVAQRKKRNMVEQQYVASARSYVITPEVLELVAPDAMTSRDPAGPAYLLVACARAQSEVASVIEAAGEAGVRVRTTCVDSELYFDTPEQRSEFTRELMQAVSDVVSRHASSVGDTSGAAATGGFRLLVGCYPIVR